MSKAPAFDKPAIGDVVEVIAVDWGLANHATSQHDPALTIVRGTLYGQVVVCNDEWLTIAPQVFTDGDVRCCLSIPFCTVEQLTILKREGK